MSLEESLIGMHWLSFVTLCTCDVLCPLLHCMLPNHVYGESVFVLILILCTGGAVAWCVAAKLKNWKFGSLVVFECVSWSGEDKVFKIYPMAVL
jgi:hypothetical protein